VANGELARQREMGVGNSVGEIAARLRMLDIACWRCSRRGRLSMARMLRDLETEAPVWTVWATLNADCPHRESMDVFRRCHWQMIGRNATGLHPGEAAEKRHRRAAS